MRNDLAGKGVFITGSSSGIGLAVAELCLERGAFVGGLALEPTPIAHERFVGFEGSVADEASVQQAVDATARAAERLDGVVCNAGIMTPGSIEDVTAVDLRRHLDVNIAGVAWAAKHAFAHLRRSGGGSIVNCASIMAYTAAPKTVAYTTSKAAVLGLTRATALDGAPHGIRCNAVCPGTIDTPMYRRHVDQQADPAAEHDRFSALFPLGRVGKARDVAGVVVFLLGDDSAYMTGSELVVDGGFMIKGTNE